MFRRCVSLGAVWFVAGFWLAAVGALRAKDSVDTKQEVQSLKQRNLALEELVREQAVVIESLGKRVTNLEQASARHERTPAGEDTHGARTSGGFNLGKVNISGEGGVAFLHTGGDGAFPNSEFRVDEAKLFVEAPVWGDVYFFTELNLATREYDELELHLGELYLDFENISQLWDQDRQLNLRLGRLDIPFGEEYQHRDAILNPLISHSLADLWGVDEGVELYGGFGKFSYVVAVQNGGVSGTRDFNPDKSVAGRLSFDPTRWLHFSASAMRTGDLDAEEDFLSELWFGSGWFRSIGGMNTTKFHANLVQGDVGLRWDTGHFKAFGGAVFYDDNDPSRDNQRDLYYYSVEAKQRLARKLYAAVRFSQIFVRDGYPIPGYGDQGDYFFTWNPANFTEEIWRLSLGLGWHFSEHLLVKIEYSFERAKETDGETRDREDFLGAEAAFRF